MQRTCSIVAGAAVVALLVASQTQAAPPPTPNGGGDPFWSPDGQTIAFGSATPNSPVDLWAVAPGAEAPQARQLTRAGSRFLAWAADGRSVYCQTFRGGHAAYYAVDVDSGLEHTILSFLGADVGVVVLSPDGRQVAYVRLTAGHHNLWMANFDGSEARQLTEGLPVRSVAWDAAGKRLAFDTGADFGEAIYVVGVSGGKPQQVFGELGSDPSWSPDGKRLVVLGMHVVTLVSADGSANRRLHVSQADRGPLSWSPDGKRLAYVAVQKNTFAIATVDVDTGATVTLAPGWAEAASPRWSPDGRSLAFEGRRATEPDGNLYVLDVSSKHTRQLTRSFPSQWSGWRSGDGKQLYFLSNAQGDVELFRDKGQGGPPTALLAVNPRLEVRLSWPRESPGGVFVNGDTVWLVSPTKAPQQLVKTEHPTSADLSPTGDRLVYVKWLEHRPSLVVRGVADGAEKELLLPPAAGLAYSKVAWSPRGQEIAFVRGNSLCKLGLTATSATVVWEPGPEEGEGVLLPPVWSPDGQRLAWGRFFVRNGDQRLEIRAADADGRHSTIVAESEIVAEHGWLTDPLNLPYAWAPDSRRLACCGELDGAPALYTTMLEADAAKLTLVQRAAAYPQWLADGRTISYTSLEGNREKLTQVTLPAVTEGAPPGGAGQP